MRRRVLFLTVGGRRGPICRAFRLALSKGILLGSGALRFHHLFIWPAFGLLIGLAVWRLAARERVSRRASGCYLVLATLAAAEIRSAYRLCVRE